MEEILERLDSVGAETQDALERFMGDTEMYLKYVYGFPDEPTMGKLRKAVAAKNYDAAEKAVHALKGIAKNLDFVPLADAAMDMLAELRDGNIADALKEYAEVEKQYRIFCSVILEERAK